MIDVSEIVAALIGVAGAFVLSWVKRRWDMKSMRRAVGRGMVIPLSKLNEMRESMHRIFSETSTDSFLILMAHNGSDFMRFATATYEQHRDGKAELSIGAVSRYVKVEIDDSYRKMLKMGEANGMVRLHVEQMDPSVLRDIYESEGVKHSNVFHVARLEDINGPERDVIVYVSMATHGDAPFSHMDETRQRLFVDKLKNDILSMDYADQP